MCVPELYLAHATNFAVRVKRTFIAEPTSLTYAADFLRYVSQTSPEPMGLEVARSHGCRVTDTSGKEYLDLLSGIGVTGIGHTHPAVVQAVQAQAERYLHAMVYGEYIQQPQVDLARRLAELAPGELSVTYFTNSGTEAVEGALKTARKYTGRSGFVSFVGSFHGDTFGSVSVGGNSGRQLCTGSTPTLLRGRRLAYF